MRVKNKIFIIIALLIFVVPRAFSETAWVNDLRNLFLSDQAIIYGINIRTFNAKDLNNDGIIDESINEERGSFLNAIKRLDEIASYGVNTIDLLPVTAVGKTKALGTAGSLYSVASFNRINPQLKDKNSSLSVNEQMKQFVDECHKRKIRVIVELPACASYDLYLTDPDLFIKDENQNPVTPSDWTDVRLLNAGQEGQINMDVYKMYRDFVNLMVDEGVDGVIANEASIKPFSFWKKLIDETRVGNPQFLFLAQASPLEKTSPSKYAVFTPYTKLLEAGFDGYYGGYSELRNWKNANELYSFVHSSMNKKTQFKDTKSLIGDFATADQVSPVLVNGTALSDMIIWLNATLPLNSYFIDGFATGDTYIYPEINKKASKSFTDDDYYFVHRGQLDIFNFSRKPEGKYLNVMQDFIISNRFKALAGNVLSRGNFVKLRTNSSSVFAYARSYNSASIIVIGNLDFKKNQTATVIIPKISNDLVSVPIKLFNSPKILKGKINTELNPGEVQVLFFNSLDIK